VVVVHRFDSTTKNETLSNKYRSHHEQAASIVMMFFLVGFFGTNPLKYYIEAKQRALIVSVIL
jgi:hypothetical protein